jgi:hypothetical protein
MSHPPYPLQWPAGWRRTPHPIRSKFRSTPTLALSRNRILHHITKLGGHDAVITSNLAAGSDTPLLGEVGVAVYWKNRTDDVERVIACDRWLRVQHNLHAINLSLEALRSLRRWGSTQIFEQAVAGFRALLPGHRHWREVFGTMTASVTLDDVKARYRDLAKVRHPDHGGTTEVMSELLRAWNEARLELAPEPVL